MMLAVSMKRWTVDEIVRQDSIAQTPLFRSAVDLLYTACCRR